PSGLPTTSAPKLRSVMTLLLTGDAERDGLRARGFIGRHVDRVDHVLDEEQAPATRLLVAGQLSLEVGGLGIGRDGSGQGPVGDANDDVRGRHHDVDVEWHAGPAGAAVP